MLFMWTSSTDGSQKIYKGSARARHPPKMEFERFEDGIPTSATWSSHAGHHPPIELQKFPTGVATAQSGALVRDILQKWNVRKKTEWNFRNSTRKCRARHPPKMKIKKSKWKSENFSLELFVASSKNGTSKVSN